MGHGTVADEIKGRAARAASAPARSSRSTRRACASAPTSTARERFMGPETSMEVQAALGSDIALVFDECTPFHVTRDYTARSTERTHRWLDRCLAWHAEHGPDDQVVYGIVQGGVEEDLRRASAPGGRRARPASASRSAARSAQDKAQMYEVVEWAIDELPERRGPRHLLGIGEIDDLAARRRARHRHLRLRDADPHRPPRHGDRARPGRALARRPGQGPLSRGRRADPRGLPVPGLRGAATRAPTCTTCSRRREPTALRLLTLHNLAYLQRLMAALRDAIAAAGWPRPRRRAAARRRAPGDALARRV